MTMALSPRSRNGRKSISIKIDVVIQILTKLWLEHVKYDYSDSLTLGI